VNNAKKYFPFATSSIAFIVYLITLAPSVIQIDSGELAAVQVTSGIAHPTGYPLFTLLGYLFSLVPFPFSQIYKLNLLAALWCAAGVGIFTYSMIIVLDHLKLFSIIKESAKQIKKSKGKQIERKTSRKEIIVGEKVKLFAVFTGAMILAFSRTFWFQSTSVEVYSLHILLMNLIILFLIRAYIADKNGGQKTLKRWLLFAFLLALGFSNHMTTLLILPAASYFYFNSRGFNKDSIKTIFIMLALFFPILILLYLYLPFQASSNPAINWGNPLDFEKIFRHISGKQYQVWLFSSTDAAKRQFVYFFNSLPKELNINLFVAAVGLFTSYFYAKKFFVFLIIAFVSTILYSINYDIVDIDSYFLLAFISLSMFAVFGVIKLVEMLHFKKLNFIVPISIIIIFIAIEMFSNYKEVNQSGTYTFEDYTKALVGSAEPNSIIFSYQWDYFISPAYYFQFVENYRKDVTIVDKELLRRSWYYNQLNRNFPDLLTELESEVGLFLDALKPFERDENYNPQLLETRYRNIMTGLVSTNIDKRTFYIAPEVFENEMQRGEFALPPGFALAPDLFLFKVVKSNSNYIPAKNPDFIIRFPENANHYTNFIEQKVGSMLSNRAMYELKFDKVERAKLYINKIKTDFPGYQLPQGLEDAIK
jgi:hypothetical protein